MDDEEQKSITKADLDGALAATLQVINDGLADDPESADIAVELVTGSHVIAHVLQRFMEEAQPRRLTVDWGDVFHKRIKGQKAWMIQIVHRERPGALSCGQVEVAKNFVSIDFLEKTPHFNHPRSAPTLIAFRFAATLAGVLGISQVRLNAPLPELVPYYMETLGLSRHLYRGEVKYLFVDFPSS